MFPCSNNSDDQKLEVDADVVIGSDGAYSAVRRELMKRPRLVHERDWGMHLGVLNFSLIVRFTLAS